MTPLESLPSRRRDRRPSQCQRPSGLLGLLLLSLMNGRHSALTDWGLGRVSVGARDVVLDVGCGGGRTLHKLATLAAEGRVCGVDHSAAAVAASRRVNRRRVETGRVTVEEEDARRGWIGATGRRPESAGRTGR